MFSLNNDPTKAVSELIFSLTPKQRFALNTPANEVLYGGAVGGGKSFLLRIASIIWASTIPNLQVYLLRRLYPDLIGTHMEGVHGYKALLQSWQKAGLVELVAHEIRFLFNGSKIYLRHCKDEDDKYSFLSTDIHVLLIDELTTFSSSIYKFLRSRVRATGLNLPKKFLLPKKLWTIPDKEEYFFPRILTASNPCGIGHAFAKKLFLDNHEESQMWRTTEDEGGMLRQFIRATTSDNPYLLRDDPGYVNRIKGLGSPSLVHAYLNGDWNQIQGAFLPELGLKHQIHPITIKRHWTKIRAFDWGYATPFSVVWIAIASEDTEAQTILGDKFTIPRGAAVVYRTWLGEKDINVGLRLTEREIAKGILEREKEDENISFGVADTQIFESDTGPSRAEIFASSGVYFFKADKRRVNGWQELRARLVGDNDIPMLYIFKSCVRLIENLSSLQHQEKDPEDCFGEGDHDCDALRYGLMTRPTTAKEDIIDPAPWNKPIKVEDPTLDELWEIHAQTRKKHDFFTGLSKL
jgi:hypothetical protein